MSAAAEDRLGTKPSEIDVAGKYRAPETVDRSLAAARGLPASVDLMTAAGLLGIGRTCAYGLVRHDRWPTPVIRVGRCIRIPTQSLLALLDPDLAVIHRPLTGQG